MVLELSPYRAAAMAPTRNRVPQTDSDAGSLAFVSLFSQSVLESTSLMVGANRPVECNVKATHRISEPFTDGIPVRSASFRPHSAAMRARSSSPALVRTVAAAW